jgi:hypothetical protein
MNDKNFPDHRRDAGEIFTAVQLTRQHEIRRQNYKLQRTADPEQLD